MKLGPPTFYVLFLVIAAPIEMILDWVQGYRGSNPDLYLKPICEGLLYIYAFIASAETLFRLSHNEKALKSKSHLRLIKLACWFIFAFFAIFYLSWDRQIVLSKKPIGTFGQVMEIVLAVLAVIASYTTFYSTHVKSAKKPTVGAKQ